MILPILLFIGTLGLSFWASMRVKSVYRKYNAEPSLAGMTGAQAAARHYFRIDAAQLAPQQAARLAVMLPAPKRFEKRPASPYLLSRTATIVARMNDVELPR